MTRDEFIAATGVSRETAERLEAYGALLGQWSERINLVGRATLGDLWRRHFFDSAQLFPLLPAGAKSLVDLGSGAGFPGLVLAVMGATGVELIEADSRKCAFLREAARITGAAVVIRQARIEAVAAGPRDIVTARGCAPLDRLLLLAARFVGVQTQCLFPKGERAEAELATVRGWSMAVARHPSRSDPRGTVLALCRITRVSGDD